MRAQKEETNTNSYSLTKYANGVHIITIVIICASRYEGIDSVCLRIIGINMICVAEKGLVIGKELVKWLLKICVRTSSTFL